MEHILELMAYKRIAIIKMTCTAIRRIKTILGSTDFFDKKNNAVKCEHS